MVLDNELLKKVTAHVVEQIEIRLREAALVSANARSFASEGLDERSIETALAVEPLIYEAKTLLEAVTIMRRAGRP